MSTPSGQVPSYSLRDSELHATNICAISRTSAWNNISPVQQEKGEKLIDPILANLEKIHFEGVIPCDEISDHDAP